MSQIIHMRGDVAGMLVFFVVAFLGAWQLLVALLRLNGLSLTGYPDRRGLSFLIGAVLIVGSGAWYFSRPGHFASPDVEGIETLVLMIAGIFVSTVVQAALASLARLFRGESGAHRGAGETAGAITIDVGGSKVPASFKPGAGANREGAVAVLLLHDYGGTIDELAGIADALSSSGHAVLAVELDGHGDSPRGITSPDMRDLVSAAVSELRERTRAERVAALGAGLGGTLAIGLAAGGLVDKAVALDPPARDGEGYVRVNTLRELGPLQVVSAFVKPPARAEGGRRVSLARLVMELPLQREVPPGKVTVVGTSEKWFNDPEALEEFALASGLERPRRVEAGHSTIADASAAVEAVLEVLA